MALRRLKDWELSQGEPRERKYVADWYVLESAEDVQQFAKKYKTATEREGLCGRTLQCMREMAAQVWLTDVPESAVAKATKCGRTTYLKYEREAIMPPAHLLDALEVRFALVDGAVDMVREAYAIEFGKLSQEDKDATAALTLALNHYKREKKDRTKRNWRDWPWEMTLAEESLNRVLIENRKRMRYHFDNADIKAALDIGVATFEATAFFVYDRGYQTNRVLLAIDLAHIYLETGLVSYVDALWRNVIAPYGALWFQRTAVPYYIMLAGEDNAMYCRRSAEAGKSFGHPNLEIEFMFDSSEAQIRVAGTDPEYIGWSVEGSPLCNRYLLEVHMKRLGSVMECFDPKDLEYLTYCFEEMSRMSTRELDRTPDAEINLLRSQYLTLTGSLDESELLHKKLKRARLNPRLELTRKLYEGSFLAAKGEVSKARLHFWKLHQELVGKRFIHLAEVARFHFETLKPERSRELEHPSLHYRKN